MSLVQSAKRPPALAKTNPAQRAEGCFEQFKQFLLLLLKLKAWRFVAILVPIVLMAAKPIVMLRMNSSMEEHKDILDKVNNSAAVGSVSNSYTASELANSKAKVLVDRSAFPAETAAATSILTAEGGNADWIEDCGPETDCRERFFHRTDDSIIALIRYSKAPEKSRAVLECAKVDYVKVNVRCAFLYKLMVLSMQSAAELRTFKDFEMFERLDVPSNATENRTYAALKESNEKKLDLKKSLPKSFCSKWIKAGAFDPLTETTVPLSISAAAVGVNFYLLISTVSCIRMLKAGGFLQQLFRNGLSVSAYWLVIWLVTLAECLLFSGVYTATNAFVCMGVFSASAIVSLFVFITLFCVYLSAVMLLLELLLPPLVVVTILAIVICVSLLVTGISKPPLSETKPNLLYIFPALFSTEYVSKLSISDVKNQYFAQNSKQIDQYQSRLSELFNWTWVGLAAAILLLTYLDFVVSSGNGLCLPPWYPFTTAFWFQRSKQEPGDAASNTGRSEKDESHIEPVVGLSPIVTAEDVTKGYRNPPFCCVAGRLVLKQLSCSIYRGQITALIGHNGAGKSTLIKILTGEELPDSGSAYIAGCLATDPLLRLALRGRISICPQFDVLCDSLTVMECVRVTLVSRAVSDSSQLDKARKMLQRLGLGDKENVLSCDLSGGQKRKVNTILALLGDPDVVFLDEPTSGLDPVSRRQLWQLLQEEKSARSIVLCTQFMDEADILADRKIFLCGGKIVCAGSSMFLKRAFGCSFTLSVSLKSKTVAQSLLAKLKQVRVKSHHETELQLEVPALNSAVLTEAVQVLETSAEVETFGLSQASLDDVFMRLGGMDSEDVIEAFKAGTLSLPQPSEIEDFNAENLSSNDGSVQSLNFRAMRASLITQFAALFEVNIKRQVRVRSSLISRFLVPAALLLIMAYGAVSFKSKMQANLLDSESQMMDILTEPQTVRVDYFGKEEIPTVCVTDAGTDSTAFEENCKSLIIADEVKQGVSKPQIRLQKFPNQSMEDFMSQRSTTEKIISEMKANQWSRGSRSMKPCVVYYASSWLKNESNKDRSVSIGIFQKINSNPATVHIYRRALVRMLKLFGMDRPLNTTALALTRDSSEALIDPGLAIVMLYFVFCLFPVSYLSDPIEDMTSRVRSYLISTGMTHLAYWVNTFVMHWAQYAICYATAVGMMMISEVFRSAYLILAAFLPVFILGIVSNLLTIYAIAVLTKIKSAIVSTFCVLAAVFLPVALVLLERSPLKMKIFIWMVPPGAPISLIHSCAKYYLYKLEYYQTTDASTLPKMKESLFIHPGIFHSLLAMPVHIVLLCSIIVIVEKNFTIKDAACFRASPAKPEKFEVDAEEGAKKEAERVLAAPRSPRNVLEVRQLHKIYPNGVHAVRGLTFGAMAGEIFGLLGANGAGKSTSMSVIVGEEAATEGVCEVRVHDGAWVSGREGASVGAIGYCPQHNPLFDSITVTEHVRFYADIRGLDSIEAERQTTRLIRSLGLEKHSNKQAGQLSGGNKRRLCLAIALLGDPALIIIDEASTGVDPENKRFIWGAIRRMTHKQRSVMVTTHSMEEVEALCGRVGIMNKGRMISVGTVQQLRSRYGDAYTLELLLPPEAESAIRQKKLSIKNAVSDHFKGAQTQEDLGLGLVIQFSVPKSAVRSLSDALKWLADSQSRLGVSYWALYQMSLDQVFVKLVRMYDQPSQKTVSKSRDI